MSMMLALLVSLAAVVLAAVACYRLYLHPLARYPGPLFARLTDWYNVYHAMKADRHIDFIRLHENYGSIVRYGPNRLSINSAAALKTIYGSQPELRKSHYYDSMQFYMPFPSTHATTDKSQHVRKRRMLAPAFSERMFSIYEHGFLEILGKLLEQIKPRDGHNQQDNMHDLNAKFMLMSFDAMGDFCFGKSFGSLEDSKKAEIIAVSSDGIRGLNAVGHMHGIARLHLDKINTGMLQAMEEYKSYSAALARDCIARFSSSSEAKEHPHCALDVLLARSEGKGNDALTVPELESECSLLVTAGAETTASSLSSILFHLLNNPNTVARLTQEIRTEFSSPEQIKIGTALDDCDYLGACINEGLRLSPPVGGCLQRQVPAGGLVIDGQHIPGGTDVGVPHHVVMRNERYFTEPLSFQPERWLSFTNNTTDMRAAFCPFSLGPTGCIGKTWGMIELKLTLAHLVWRYDLELALTGDEAGVSSIERMKTREEQCLDRFVVSDNKGLLVKIRNRRS